MRLDIYIARRFVRAFGVVTAVFVAILVPLDLAEQLTEVDGDAGLRAAFRLTLLNMPTGLYDLMPLLTILATVFLFLGLARTSELVVVRASGRSALRLALSPVVTAALLGLIGVGVLNPIVAATQMQYDAAIARYNTGEVQTVSVSDEGLWLRQGGGLGQTVIRAGRSNADGTTLQDASFFEYDPDGALVRRVDAQAAILRDGAWVLTGAKIWPVHGHANPETAARTLTRTTLASTLTRERIRDSFGRPSAVPIYQLPAFIAQLNAAGFGGLQHRTHLQTELSMPLMLMAMVLIGGSFTMRPTRFGRTGLMVMFALLLGFGLYFVRDFAAILGQNQQLPVAVAAWAPPVAAILLAVGVLLQTEDG